MKKNVVPFLCALILLMSITSCAKKREALETSFQPDFTVAENALTGSMAAVEGGYIVALDTHAFYIDGETLSSTFFCPNPSCGHRRSGEEKYDCLAEAAGRAIGALQYYDGELCFKSGNIEWEKEKLYSKGHPTPYELYGVKLDGTGLHILQDLWTIEGDPWPDEDTGSNYSYPFAILGDDIMFCPRSHMVCVGKLGGKVEDAKVLFSYDAGNPKIDGASAHWALWVDSGCFYYCGVNYPNAVREGRPSFLVYRYDPETENNTLVWRADEMTDTYSLNGFYIKDNVFYYHVAEHELENNETGVWKCDLETGKTVKLAEGNGAEYAEFDSDHIYMMHYDTFLMDVLDREAGDKIATLDFGGAVETGGRTVGSRGGPPWADIEYMGSDDKWLFVACHIRNYYGTGDFTAVLYAIAKDELAENNWREVVAFDSNDYLVR